MLRWAMRGALIFVLFGIEIGNTSDLHDVLIRGGTLYDGSGSEPFIGDIAVDGDLITAIGKLSMQQGRIEIDAKGLAVAPGLINMLSQASQAILKDPRALSDVKQGVTLEIFGEGTSMGPIKAARRSHPEKAGKESTPWTTLGEALEYLEQHGIGVNVASFVGAATLRIHEVGYEAREATPAELTRMQRLAREAMEQGALGLSSALIYTPGIYATTDELTALARAVSGYGGIYISKNYGLLLIDLLIISLTSLKMKIRVHFE